MRRKNVFVVGLDDFHRAMLESLPIARRCRFHGLLEHDDVAVLHSAPVDELLERARARLDAFREPVDAVVGYWDFPTSTLLPILRRERNLPGPPLEAVLKCEHKYWSRLEQRACVPECVPAFTAVDPFDETVLERGVGLDFPFWIKPVKSYCSQLGFRVRNPQELERAILRIREEIDRFAGPFDFILGRAELPEAVRVVDGGHCIAESIISAGWQCTLEGWAAGGEIRVYGVVDSVREGEQQSSFFSYEYPSQLPDHVQGRMFDVCERFLRHIGFDDSPFNAELFYDASQDRIWLLEVNTRLSRSHAPLFKLVDGASHLQVMVQTGLGERPEMPFRMGRYRCAGKFMLRRYTDATVVRAPDPETLRALEASIPGTHIQVNVREGVRLSGIRDQDSYSFEIADVFTGGDDRAQLYEHYRRCLDALVFHLAPPGPA